MEAEVISYGILALVPPVLAIGLALYTKNIIVSLFSSLIVTSTIINGWNIVTGFTSMIKVYMFGSLAETMNTQSLFMMVIIGGFVALLTQSGGAQAFTQLVTKKVDSRAKCEAGIWCGGLFVWFTDNGNSLIVGPIFEALGEKLKVSREKFAYILDCTTTPICAMVPFIGWGVYTMGLIQTELDAAAITSTDSWSLFIAGIPFNFYAILTLLMAGFMGMTQWDFGPMLKAQNRAMESGETIREGGTPMRSTQKIELAEGLTPKIYTVIAPLVVLLVVMFAYLTSKGLWYQSVAGSDIRTGVASGFMVATLLLMVICKKEKIFTFQESLDVIIGGMKNMMFMCVVLVLAWSLSSATSDIGTAAYLTEVTTGFLNPGLLPLITFIIGAIMSLATGTSWGTMAILMPIAVPMAVSFGVSLPVIVASVISGAIFGDHCSPISDTTILASIGAGCDHIDHFRTQMPYAIVVAIVCSVMFLIAGWYPTPLMTVIAAVVLIVAIYILHKISVKKYGVVKDTAKE